MTLAQRSLAVVLSSLIGLATIPGEVGAAPQANASSANPANSQEEYAVLGADELDALIAPIALYPDALLAQVIGAATFPDQALEADGWLKQNSSLKDKALTDAVDQQDWDPSIIYQCDLGDHTADPAQQLDAFDPDDFWRPSE